MDMSTETSTVFGHNFTNTRPVTALGIIPPVIQFVVGVAGNIAALVILIRSSMEHKWKPFYRFVGGLFASDLLSILLPYPFIIRAYASKSTVVFPNASICGFISFVILFSIMTNAFTICAMSLDRFLAFIFPLTYRNLSKVFRINLTLVGIWIASAILCSLHLIGFGSFRFFYPGTWCFVNFTSDDAKDKAVTYLYAVIGLLIIVTTIALNVTVIFSFCWKFCKGEKRSAKDKRNDVFIIIYLVTIVTLFTLCTTPIVIQMLINAATEYFNDEQADLLTARISAVNILTDPWIYLLFKKATSIPFGRLARYVLQIFRMTQVKGEGESSHVTNRQELHDRKESTSV